MRTDKLAFLPTLKFKMSQKVGSATNTIMSSSVNLFSKLNSTLCQMLWPFKWHSYNQHKYCIAWLYQCFGWQKKYWSWWAHRQINVLADIEVQNVSKRGIRNEHDCITIHCPVVLNRQTRRLGVWLSQNLHTSDVVTAGTRFFRSPQQLFISIIKIHPFFRITVSEKEKKLIMKTKSPGVPPVKFFSKSINLFFGYFDPVKNFFDTENK